MAAVLVLLTVAVAFANGANDVSKGIATLVGSGTSKYRAAVLWGSVWTVAGGLAAAFATQGLVATFSGKGILPAHGTGNTGVLLSVAIGAVLWLAIATATGLPVSTTHALTGALCGVGIASAGLRGVVWGTVANRTALPLALSPLLSLALMLLFAPLFSFAFRRFARFCVCLEKRETAAVPAVGVSAAASTGAPPLPVLEIGSECPPETLVRVNVLDSLHWLSAGATSFFRGLNDTPKILALGVAAVAAWGLSQTSFYALVALSMGLGSLLAGLRVTNTLARKVTRISHDGGLAANVTTSLLVGFASSFALPVSTTHVSSGAILGIAAGSKTAGIHWKTVREILLAWVVTLPVAGLVAALVYRLAG
jgi:PiT family inorganic phosphate transporter